MNIKVKKKNLHWNNYKLRCAVGKRGITSSKKEGDEKTPKGAFTFKFLLYRKDKLSNFKCLLKKKAIKKDMGWCDDPSSKFYNQLIRFPFKKSAERLWLKKNMYDVILIISFNMRPIKKNNGSAIFLHIAKKNYSPTRGCIALNKKNILLLISKIDDKTKLIIN